MSRLPMLFALVALAACESNLITNEPLPRLDGRDAGKASRKDAAASNEGDDDEPTDEEVASDDEVTGDDSPVDESSSDDDVDAGDEPTEDATMSQSDAGEEPEPMESKIKGSGIAAKCLSYGLPKNGMCAGYYCGITAEDLAAEYKPGNKCDTTPEKICEGQLTRDVAKCARDTKSNPANSFDSDAQIRAKVQTCVLKIPAHADTEEDCLSCFLDAAQCASSNCLTQCLIGDSAQCDKCRMDNNCNQPVPACAGFPTPF
jgi:hypothetical protein